MLLNSFFVELGTLTAVPRFIFSIQASRELYIYTGVDDRLLLPFVVGPCVGPSSGHGSTGKCSYSNSWLGRSQKLKHLSDLNPDLRVDALDFLFHCLLRYHVPSNHWEEEPSALVKSTNVTAEFDVIFTIGSHDLCYNLGLCPDRSFLMTFNFSDMLGICRIFITLTLESILESSSKMLHEETEQGPLS